MQVGDYSAWICIEGAAASIYDTEKDGRSASCWIASQVGKKFSVNWYNVSREVPIQAMVSIDGNVCDTHIMLDAHRYPTKPHGVGISYARTSDWTRRDFQFSSILVSDDDNYLHTIGSSMNIGTIRLELHRVEVETVYCETLKHRYGAPTLDNQVVHEKSKKAGAHLVTYGDEYPSAAPTVDMVRARLVDPSPLITFTFKYRPYDILLANGIIPRPISSISSSSRIEPDEKTAAQIRRLETRLNALKSKAKLSSSAGIQKNSTSRSTASRRFKGKSKSTNIPSDAEVIDLTCL